MKLDPGCNGIVFIQMKRKDGDPSPKEIAQHAMTSAAATKKHMSRFLSYSNCYAFCQILANLYISCDALGSS